MGVCVSADICQFPSFISKSTCATFCLLGDSSLFLSASCWYLLVCSVCVIKIFYNDNTLEFIRHVCNNVHKLCSHESQLSAAVQLCIIKISTELADALCMSPLRRICCIVRCKVIYKYAYIGWVEEWLLCRPVCCTYRSLLRVVSLVYLKSHLWQLCLPFVWRCFATACCHTTDWSMLVWLAEYISIRFRCRIAHTWLAVRSVNSSLADR